jgi:hypothetical protein
MISLSKETIKRIFKENWDCEISRQSCVYLCNILKEILEQIVKDTIQEVKETNKIRESANLPPIKRIKTDVLCNICVKFLKERLDLTNGKLGQYNSDTNLLTDAEEVI